MVNNSSDSSNTGWVIHAQDILSLLQEKIMREGGNLSHFEICSFKFMNNMVWCLWVLIYQNVIFLTVKLQCKEDLTISHNLNLGTCADSLSCDKSPPPIKILLWDRNQPPAPLPHMKNVLQANIETSLLEFCLIKIIQLIFSVG